MTSYRQKLRRSLDTFEFGALIEGVSTLEDDAAQPPVDLLATIPVITTALASAEIAPEPVLAVDLAVLESLDIQTALPLPAAEPVKAQSASVSSHQDRLCAGILELSGRLFTELSRFRAALCVPDALEAGERLALINQLSELLVTVDPNGDVARQFKIHGAPPVGRGWPRAAWSVVEFAASPLSGLLPAETDESFVREVMYSAWGVTPEEPIASQ